MNMRLSAGAVLLLALSSCLFQEPPAEGPSTETGNPSVSGTLRDIQGNPVAGTVKLYALPGTGLPDTGTARIPPLLVEQAVVGADGKYRLDSLALRVYALEGRDAQGARFSLDPRIPVADAGESLKRDLTLKPPALIRGRVTRGPNARPPGVLADENIQVRLAGIDRLAVTDTSGRFALENVPAGLYLAAFAASDGHYEPAYRDSLRVGSGDTLDLPLVELDWSRYIDPPAPAGFTVTVDSTAGVVRLSWRSVKLRNPADPPYLVTRFDTAAGIADSFPVADTVFLDSLSGLALRYGVQSRTSLGNLSPVRVSGEVPAGTGEPPGGGEPPVGGGSGALFLAGRVLRGTDPSMGTSVLLYSETAAADSGPAHAILAGRAVTDSLGRFVFRGLSEGRFSAEAALPLAAVPEKAMRVFLPARADSLRLDTLYLEPTGALQGAAGRDGLWATQPLKGEAGVSIVLSGTPYEGATGSYGPDSFQMRDLPAGTYRAVVHAMPYAYFLPDTLDVAVEPGVLTLIPGKVNGRYNPAAPPPKLASLRIESSTRDQVVLRWSPVDARAYPLLQGYRVLHLDASGAVRYASPALAGDSFTDDVSALAIGIRAFYVVRVLGPEGIEGANGGDGEGNPVAHEVR